MVKYNFENLKKAIEDPEMLKLFEGTNIPGIILFMYLLIEPEEQRKKDVEFIQRKAQEILEQRNKLDDSKINEYTNKIKSPSDVIIEAFDEAWLKQNGKLPNIKVFEKIFMAMPLKKLYQDIVDCEKRDDIEIAITYEIKEKQRGREDE